MIIDKNYFPGWVRKSFTFTIDDGNIPLDKKFIDIVKPNGIIGTFNLKDPDLKNYTPEFYRDLYRGFGISNHCKMHPFALTEDKRRPISDDKFDPNTADPAMLYKTDIFGVYKYFHDGRYWAYVCEAEAYCALADEGRRAIEAVFGEGSVTTYVWPYFEQKDPVILDHIINKSGYMAVRKTGSVKDSTGFAMPSDRMHWSYNANHKEILEQASLYENYQDDGELKFFCFGVHSHDFERDNMWNTLVELAEKYGNRPEDYYYASVEDIFKYEDAVASVIVGDTFVENPTDIKLYIKLDGKRKVLAPHSRVNFK